jgi:hypothetical protein
VARTVGRILLTLTGLAVTGFVLVVLIGLWDRHEQEITASLSRIYDRYLALQAGFPSNPKTRAGVEPERAGPAGRGQVATTQTFQQQPKLVGTGAVGSSNQGMSVALSVDGNTAIVGGPGPNWVGLETTLGIDRHPLASARPVRHGCLPAVAVSGHNKTNWSAPVSWRA